MARQFRITGLAGPLCEVSLAEGAGYRELTEAIASQTGIVPITQRLHFGTLELSADNADSGDIFGGAGVLGAAVELVLVRRSMDQVDWLKRARWLDRLPGLAREDPEVVLKAVTANGMMLRVASEDLQGDREVALAAVTQTMSAIMYTSEGLRADAEFMLAAMCNSAWVLRHAAAPLLADRAFALRAVARKGGALKFVGEKFRSDREVVVTAVCQDGSALQFATAALQADRDLVLAAVAQDGLALSYAAEALQADPDAVGAAAKQNAQALRMPGIPSDVRAAVEGILSYHGRARAVQTPQRPQGLPNLHAALWDSLGREAHCEAASIDAAIGEALAQKSEEEEGGVQLSRPSAGDQQEKWKLKATGKLLGMATDTNGHSLKVAGRWYHKEELEES